MSDHVIDRRRLLAGGGLALAAASAGLIAASAEAAPACRAIHDRLARELDDVGAKARLAVNNVYSAAWDIACPCCGDPLFGTTEERPRF